MAVSQLTPLKGFSINLCTNDEWTYVQSRVVIIIKSGIARQKRFFFDMSNAFQE